MFSSDLLYGDSHDFEIFDLSAVLLFVDAVFDLLEKTGRVLINLFYEDSALGCLRL